MSQEPISGGGGPIVTIVVGLAVIAVAGLLIFSADPQVNETEASEVNGAAPAAAAAASEPVEMAVMPLELPNPAFAGTPSQVPPGVNIDRSRMGKKRLAFVAPADAKNLSADIEVSSSDENPFFGSLDLVTDGGKEPLEGYYVELAPDKQHVTIDLGAEHVIYAIALWHYHLDPRIYRDVVVQISNDPDFEDATIVFNNDSDNSSGFGVGENYEYFESDEGELIAKYETKDGRIVMTSPLGTARYVRCWSNGSTSDDQNHYTEIEVWGKP